MPVLLLLLVVSFTGNILLVSKRVSDDQEDRVQRGLAIIADGKQAKLHIDAVLTNVDAMLGSGSDISRRLAAKGALGAAFKQADEVIRFMGEAQKISGKSFPSTKRDAASFFGEAERSMLQLGNHDGPLTAPEQAYLQMMKQVYEQLKTDLAPFEYKTVSRDIGLTVQTGGAWVDMASRMQEAINAPDNVVFKP